MYIESKRPLLRSYEERDTEGLWELWSNPRVNCYRKETAISKDEISRMIAKSNPEFDVSVCLKSTGEFIGAPFGEIEDQGYLFPLLELLERYGHRGYALEAAKAYFNYLFTEKNIRRIYTYAEIDTISFDEMPGAKPLPRLFYFQDGPGARACVSNRITEISKRRPDGAPLFSVGLGIRLSVRRFHPPRE